MASRVKSVHSFVDSLIAPAFNRSGAFTNRLFNRTLFLFIKLAQHVACRRTRRRRTNADSQPSKFIVSKFGDNIFQASLKEYADSFLSQKTGARVLLKQVSNPRRFGVAHVSDGKIVRIEEKPKEPKSDCAIIGIYFYDATVYDIIRGLKPSARGELEITDVNNAYIAKGQLAYDMLEGWWTDAGTFESLDRANELVVKDPPE